MTTHLMKPRCPLSDMRTRCNKAFADCGAGDMIGTENNIDAVDCAGCLRSVIVEMRLKEIPLSDDSPAAQWRAGSDTGVSSITIWSVMTGLPGGHAAGVPWDPSDFGRCYRLLKKIPEWRARMPEVAEEYPRWAALVRDWDRLSGIYEREIPSGGGPAPELYCALHALLVEGGSPCTGNCYMRHGEYLKLWPCPKYGIGDPILVALETKSGDIVESAVGRRYRISGIGLARQADYDIGTLERGRHFYAWLTPVRKNGEPMKRGKSISGVFDLIDGCRLVEKRGVRFPMSGAPS